MHELSVCRALLRMVEPVASAPVARVVVRVGALSGVEPDLLARAYPHAAAGTRAEGSELVIEPAPIRVRCETCGAESGADAGRLTCAACGDWHTRLIGGDELLLLRVELADEASTEETMHV